MALAVLAALAFVLGAAFEVAAYAVLTPANVGTSTDFIHAFDWLRFAAGVIAVVAVCAAGWELVLRKAWGGVWEVAVGATGTLLVAIDWLIVASSDRPGSAPAVVGATGIGIWALLVLSRAARRSLVEHKAATEGTSALLRHAILWLVAASGLLILAVGFGFTPEISNKGVAITAGILEAVGVAVLLGALAAARTQRYLFSRAVSMVLAGLVILAVSFAAAAVVAGVVFGPGATLTGIRVGLPIAITFELVAVAVLGLAAWMRLRELVVATP
ncbi:MAG TPA: hypothetical protein VNF47_17440 [Streptosporangiaceae bacterium]|nr:hypothetical protein [Streptosporangiaceae bacterium]